jgi:predicted GNAT superfamily acetyltransferase
MDKVHIRPLQSLEDYQACVEIQRVVWGHADLDITPVHHFCISVETGAILLGAFVGKTLAGYVYSFPAVFGKKHCQHSHHLAVLPEFQGYGFGKKLKWAQWGEAVKRGYKLITWTYDPLQARNANLNLHTLGVIGRTYLDDFYGCTPALKLGDRIPTDRLLVEWAITSRRVEARMEGKHAPLDPARFACAVWQKAGGVYPVIIPEKPDLSLGAPRVLVEVPKSIHDLKPVNGLVGRWQKAVRTAFKHYFCHGYRLDDFIFGDRAYYVLKKG